MNISRNKIICFNLLAIVISLIVILGWITNNHTLVQLSPIFPAMMFNTAVCLLLVAIAYILISLKFIKVGKIIITIPLIISSLTLVQYLANINLHIDNLLFHPEITTIDIFEGRMSPSTILCFIILAFAGLIFKEEDKTHPLIRACFLASINSTLLLSLISILGYVFSKAFAFKWGEATGMSINTSLCFFFISLGLFKLDNVKLNSRNNGAIISAIIFITFFISWSYFIGYQYRANKNFFNQKLLLANNQIKNSLQERDASIANLEDKLAWTNKKNISQDMQTYFDVYPDLELIYFVKDKKEYLFSKNDLSAMAAKNLIQQCQNNPNKQICFTNKKNVLTSFIVVFDNSFLKEIISQTFNKYKTNLLVNDIIAYSNVQSQTQLHPYIFSDSFNFLGEKWTTEVLLTVPEYEALNPIFLDFYFLLGMLISLVILLLFYFIEKKENALKKLSSYDELTDTINRRALMKALANSIEEAKQIDEKFAILFIDLDNFKQKNDSLGHLVGDKILLVVADRLRLYLRANDYVARVGGDEFIVVLRDIKDKESLASVLRRILNLFNQQIQTCTNQDIIQTISIGVTIFSKEKYHKTQDELISQADKAMYFAKQAGSNCFYFFDDIKK